jgi:hypothetical protein
MTAPSSVAESSRTADANADADAGSAESQEGLSSKEIGTLKILNMYKPTPRNGINGIVFSPTELITLESELRSLEHKEFITISVSSEGLYSRTIIRLTSKANAFLALLPLNNQFGGADV